MDNKLSELSKPVAWFTDDHLTDKSATTYSEEIARRWRDKPWFVGNLYSQEYVSALLARIEEIEKKETWRERQSVIDGLAGAGEAWSDIEEYMVKWDEERRNG